MPIDVGDEVETFAWQRESIQRQHGHLRPQVRTANADVDNVGDGVVGPDFLGKGQHRIQGFMHLVQLNSYIFRSILLNIFVT